MSTNYAVGVSQVPGRLSRLTVGGEKFDVETEATYDDTIHVRTRVYYSGAVVEAVEWELPLESVEELAMVNAQHDAVVRVLRSMSGDFESGIVAALERPDSLAAEAPAPRVPERRVVAISDRRASSVSGEPRDLASALAATGFVEAGVVIDEEGSIVCEVNGGGRELAEAAFLLSGLDLLVSSAFDLGEYHGASVDMAGLTVYVARDEGLSCAFVSPQRVRGSRALAETRRVLSDTGAFAH